MIDPLQRRWDQVMSTVARLLPADDVSVLVDGPRGPCMLVADRLAAAIRQGQRPCTRLDGPVVPPGADGDSAVPAIAPVVVAAGPGWRSCRRWDVVVWVRAWPPGPPSPAGQADGEDGADIVLDLHDPQWPVIRRIAAAVASDARWYIDETRAFFAVRAATWDAKFAADLPAYDSAIAEAGIPDGGAVADVGCGTGRALPALRRAVGPQGKVIAVDLTPEMLAEARGQGRSADVLLAVADARRLPLVTACVDAVFAAALINHLPNARAGLAELGRITRPGGRVILFHPSGRAAMAARHGRALRPDEPLAEDVLRESMRRSGWQLTRYEDGASRFFALAIRGH